MPLLIAYLKKRAILDHPNHRSSHTTPTLKGAGLVIIPVITIIWVILQRLSETHYNFEILIISAIALVIAGVSWIDDLRNLSALFRLATHLIAVTVALYFMPDDSLVWQGLLPPFLDKVFAALAWVWFINLFNFMDGIDGISGVQAMSIGIGVCLIGLLGATPQTGLLPFGSVIVGASLGFLFWNWHPAKIFLGDVGSAPLGFLLGWLLLSLAYNGAWAAALILPGYYLADATLTLIKRMVQGKRIWQAHNEHYYQKAVQSGMSHTRVCGAIIITNTILIGCAIYAVAGSRVTGLVISGITIIALLWMFTYKKHTS